MDPCEARGEKPFSILASRGFLNRTQAAYYSKKPFRARVSTRLGRRLHLHDNVHRLARVPGVDELVSLVQVNDGRLAL